MNDQPLVSIIVVTVNTPEITEACLQSVIRHTSVPYELIVVNNSSGIEIRKVLKKFKDIRLIQNQKNLGYTKAANQGASESRGKFLCFLNSDTLVPPGWLERLLEAASLPGVGAAGAKRWGQPRTTDRAMRWESMLLTDEALKKKRSSKSVTRLCGFCLMIPRPVMASLGPFDERYFFGFEDFDYSLRLRLKGYKLLLVESLFISHIAGASSTVQRHRQLVKVSKEKYHTKWSRFFGRKLKNHDAILSYAAKQLRQDKNIHKLFKSTKSKPAKQIAVSVMMAAHNTGRWISEAIESVLAQDFSSFELIVVDDGSTDRTAQIVRRYLKDPRLRFYQNKTQVGISATRNRILSLSRGKYIAVCDSDDVMGPSFMKQFTEFMEANPKAGWAYGNRVVIDGSGMPLGRVRAIPMDGRIEYKQNVMNHAGSIIRKRLMLEAGGYDENFTTAEDYDLAFKISQRSQIRALPGEPQYFYRWHGENTSARCTFARRTASLLKAWAKNPPQSSRLSSKRFQKA